MSKHLHERLENAALSLNHDTAAAERDEDTEVTLDLDEVKEVIGLLMEASCKLTAPFTLEQIDAAADELADGEAHYRHALEVTAQMLAGGDIDGARAHCEEVLRG